MKFVLIEVQERNICEPAFFDTQQEAFDEMCSRFAKTMGVTVEAAILEYYIPDNEAEESCILSTQAWTERYGKNFDWEIFELDIDICSSAV